MEDDLEKETTEKPNETKASDDEIDSCDCTIKENGDVNCITTEENIKRIQRKGIKPRRLVIEAKD